MFSSYFKYYQHSSKDVIILIIGVISNVKIINTSNININVIVHLININMIISNSIIIIVFSIIINTIIISSSSSKCSRSICVTAGCFGDDIPQGLAGAGRSPSLYKGISFYLGCKLLCRMKYLLEMYLFCFLITCGVHCAVANFFAILYFKLSSNFLFSRHFQFFHHFQFSAIFYFPAIFIFPPISV